MARVKAQKFQGSTCKGDCSGHRAGYNYALNGGAKYNYRSSSFTNGMRIARGLKPISTIRKKK